MQYVYLNNIRGFNRALIPIRACNFLVGENSTGKSSFLSILKLLSRPDFYFNPRFSFGEGNAVVAYGDVVSAWASDKSFFDVGLVDVATRKGGRIDLSFSVHRFTERNAHPFLSQHVQRRSNVVTHIRFAQKRTEYRRQPAQSPPGTEIEAIEQFWPALDAFEGANDKFKTFPKQFAGGLPLGIALSILPSLESGSTPTPQAITFEVPLGMQLTWIAPIRTKPQRIYDGLSREYSAEGVHVPFVLKQQLKSAGFLEKLTEFGEASGLFEVIATHTFGRGERNPFEVLIRFKGAEFNIENVGYGVSQVLPLVVEFLARDQGRRFAVQQPEVHLHPRAQAALGSLIFQLAKERKHTFLIETHSDFLIDRYRLEMSSHEDAPNSQVIFFSRTAAGNTATPLEITAKGQYPADQPRAFRDFFIREEMRLLSL